MNDPKAMVVTLPPNHKTSPYAIKIIVKFLKIVYTGILKNCNALEDVYIIATNNTAIGDHFLASSLLNCLYVITPNAFNVPIVTIQIID